MKIKNYKKLVEKTYVVLRCTDCLVEQMIDYSGFLRFPEFVTPSPFIIPHQVPQYTQPPNLFGNFFPLHPWQFSQGVPQLPSVSSYFATSNFIAAVK